MTLGERLRMLRGQRSLRHVAARAGITYTFLHHIEQGCGNPTYHVLCRLAVALDVTLTDLFEDVQPTLRAPRSSGKPEPREREQARNQRRKRARFAAIINQALGKE